MVITVYSLFQKPLETKIEELKMLLGFSPFVAYLLSVPITPFVLVDKAPTLNDLGIWFDEQWKKMLSRNE